MTKFFHWIAETNLGQFDYQDWLITEDDIEEIMDMVESIIEADGIERSLSSRLIEKIDETYDFGDDQPMDYDELVIFLDEELADAVREKLIATCLAEFLADVRVTHLVELDPTDPDDVELALQLTTNILSDDVERWAAGNEETQ